MAVGGRRPREAVGGRRPRETVGGRRAERQLVVGQESREASSRSWRGRTEGQSTPDTEQRGEETR